MLRFCNHCQKEFDTEDNNHWYKNPKKSMKLGYFLTCRVHLKRPKKETILNRIKDNKEQKFCKFCNNWFDLDNEQHWYKSPNKASKIGYYLVCRTKLNWKPKNNPNKFVNGIEYKYCEYCQDWFDINSDHWYKHNNKASKKGYSLRCHKRVKEQSKSWLNTHKEHRKNYRRNTLPQQREYQQKKRKADPKYKLDKGMERDICIALKGKKAGRHWEDLVGYTKEDLMQHLESLFIEGMTWENHNMYGWHIDHKIPKSWFKYETAEDLEFKKCWALENLQPKWAKDNWSKHNRYSD